LPKRSDRISTLVVIDKLRAILAQPNTVLHAGPLRGCKGRVVSGPTDGCTRDVARNSDVDSFVVYQLRSTRGSMAPRIGTDVAGASSQSVLDGQFEIVSQATPCHPLDSHLRIFIECNLFRPPIA
jgi:hypothetical protein